MPKIEETQLPGVGLRHDFLTRAGARVGVISHRTGRRELLIYSGDDPDACSEVLRLDEDEGHALADLLGGSTVSEHVGDVTQQVEGLTIDWLKVGPDSGAAGKSIAGSGVRTGTGASIVAVIRHGETTPAPGGEHVLEAGDTVVVVGTYEGIESLRRLLSGA
jgi:TrkA domain protein